MTGHSTIVGGSTVDRLLCCPGSFQLIQSIPAVVDTPSEYAAYGSCMHAVMERLAGLFSNGFPPDETKMIQAARELEGETVCDRKITDAHLNESIFPAIDNLYDLMDSYGGGFRTVANELRVRFPGVPGAFGTADLVIASKKHAILVDWKFGQGVPVKAVYRDEHGERVNPQLLFYFAGALHTVPELFKDKRFVVAIIQPRTAETLTHTTISRKDIDYFIEDVDAAIVAALQRDPELHDGEHCRWCPALPVCPKHTGPLFELTDDGVKMPERQDNTNDAAYGEFLAKAKYLADIAAGYKKQIDEQIHNYLTAGGTVPGWRLKLKPKLRQWVNEKQAAKELDALGFREDEIWQHKLQTFAVAEKAAKRLGVKIPDYLRAAPETDETVIAPENDPAPLLEPPQAREEFIAALKQLRAN
jgi:hypothetical protein